MAGSILDSKNRRTLLTKMDEGTVITSIDGRDLRRIFSQGRRALEENVEAINALNVFPVPDGDTGTNMLLTMKALGEETARTPSDEVGAMARGALLGARGNSGVILAQFLQGLAKGLNGKSDFNCHDLAMALSEATTAAYKAVGNPTEGTMLTVMRDVAAAAEKQAAVKANVLELWETMCRAARDAVAMTPYLLPVLREAGVVDAGGLGLSVILEGALRGLRGEEPYGVELPAPRLETSHHAIEGMSEAFLSAAEEDLYGYCTQFLVQGVELDADAIKERMESLANSTVVIGGDTMVRVHVHTTDPGTVLSYAVSIGTLSQVNIANMDEQRQEFVAARRKEQATSPVGVLAVALGRGLTEVFLDSGASAVLSGGDTMNPSTQELLDAAEGVAAERVIVLANNPNIVPAAEQAAPLSSRPLKVIPTKSIPQGIAALLAFNPQQDFQANVEAMEKAASSVVSGAVGTASRDAYLRGVKVLEGQTMGLLERQMVVAGDDRIAVLRDLMAKANPGQDSLITLYWGADTQEAEANQAADDLRRNFNWSEVEVVFGGQPHYNYIVSVE
jgi:DAK2 domain fusion protein YloV